MLYQPYFKQDRKLMNARNKQKVHLHPGRKTNKRLGSTNYEKTNVPRFRIQSH